MPRGRPRKSDEVLMKSAEFIGWALGGLEREIALTRERLLSLTSQATRLRERLGPAVLRSSKASAKADDGGGAPTGRKRRRHMSAEARKRMSEMMKKRWAERRKKHA
jgi:hypothetical protein